MKKNFKSSTNTRHSKSLSRHRAPVRACVLGASVGLICLSVLLFICAVICLLSNEPHSLLSPLSLFCVYASAFVSGLVAAKKNHSYPLLVCGILCGIGYILMLSLVLFILDLSLLSGSVQSGSPWLRAICMPASILGAMCSISHSSPKRHKRH